MRVFTAAHAAKRFGRLLKLADAAPVEITRHGNRQRYVLMSAQVFETYEMIRSAHAENRVIAVVNTALGKLMTGEETGIELLEMSNVMMKRFLDATRETL